MLNRFMARRDIAGPPCEWKSDLERDQGSQSLKSVLISLSGPDPTCFCYSHHPASSPSHQSQENEGKVLGLCQKTGIVCLKTGCWKDALYPTSKCSTCQKGSLTCVWIISCCALGCRTRGLLMSRLWCFVFLIIVVSACMLTQSSQPPR